jgi:hypothetical protein
LLSGRIDPYALQDPPRSAPSFGGIGMRPALETLLRMATTFNVSLAGFLEIGYQVLSGGWW